MTLCSGTLLMAFTANTVWYCFLLCHHSRCQYFIFRLLITIFRSWEHIVSNTSRMLLLELLHRLQNSYTSLLFWNIFTGLKFLNKLNTKSYSHKILNTTQPSYLYDLVFSLLTVITHALHLILLHHTVYSSRLQSFMTRLRVLQDSTI